MGGRFERVLAEAELVARRCEGDGPEQPGVLVAVPGTLHDHGRAYGEEVAKRVGLGDCDERCGIAADARKDRERGPAAEGELGAVAAREGSAGIERALFGMRRLWAEERGELWERGERRGAKVKRTR